MKAANTEIARYKSHKSVRNTVLVMTAVILFIMIVFSAFSGVESDASTADTYRQVQVSQGETLWEIASEFSSSNQDVRTTVKEICEINDIQPEDIQAGDTIFVPVQ